jgi:sterol desaturase/sphingolipid hydroxylase (fatty acid hydroxylase superfamily)
LNFINYFTDNKPSVSNDVSNLPVEEYKYEFHKNVITATAIESITHLFIKTTIINTSSSKYDLIYFIPVSFMFEFIFDFFHYFSHRLLHHKYLYKHFHKKHHKFAHPTSIITFYQDPVDLIITNSMPTIITLFIIPRISYLQFNFIIVYKNFVEISGHTGKISYPACSFPQFVWLPKMLQMELYTENHDLHHSLNNCNYAKRFSFWDKVFNTYADVDRIEK